MKKTDVYVVVDTPKKAKEHLKEGDAEEKSLLEHKKELEVGKWHVFSWYHDPNDVMGVYLIDKINYDEVWFKYGVNISGNYWSKHNWYSKTPNWRLATHQEVEQALIEEAKRRGFVNGAIGNNSNIHGENLEDYELFFNNQYEFDEKDNLLKVIIDDHTSWTVFKDGKWADLIKQPQRSEDSDNFTDSDVAIVERLHDTLLDNHGYSLGSKLLTDARMLVSKIKSKIK